MPDNTVSVVITADNQSSPVLLAAQAEIDGLRAKADQMATQMAAAGEKTTVSMTQARESAALLGEEVGVHIPRGLATFLAELPAVGQAMSLAFSGFAILGLIEVLVKAGEKIAEFVQNTFIYTQAEKDAAAATKSAADAIGEQTTELAKLQEAYLRIGLSGSALTGLDLSEARAEVDKLQAKLTDLNETIFLIGRDIGNTPASAIPQLKEWADQYAAQIATLNQKILNLTTLRDQQVAQEDAAAAAKAIAQAQARGESVLSSEKTTYQANLDLLTAYAQLDYAQSQISQERESELLTAANEQKYQSQLDYEQKKLALLQSGTDQNAIRDQYAEIEALQTEHQAKELGDYAAFLTQFNDLRLQFQDLGEPVIDPAIGNLIAAYQELGVTSTEVLQQQAAEAQKDYALIQSSGVSALVDIEAHMKELQATIAAGQSAGTDTSGLAAQLKGLQAQYDSLTGVVERESPEMRHLVTGLGNDLGNFFTNIATQSETASQAFVNFGKSILKTIDDMAAKILVSHILNYFQDLFSFGGSASQLTGGFQPSDLAPAGSGGVFGTPPGFASGGGMQAGQIGMVGELGPELWIPDTAGSIIPTKDLAGGGGHNTYNFDLRGSNGVTQQQLDAVARVVEERSVARAKIEIREFNLRRV
jgi:hypothetical protein